MSMINIVSKTVPSPINNAQRKALLRIKFASCVYVPNYTDMFTFIKTKKARLPLLRKAQQVQSFLAQLADSKRQGWGGINHNHYT